MEEEQKHINSSVNGRRKVLGDGRGLLINPGEIGKPNQYSGT